MECYQFDILGGLLVSVILCHCINFRYRDKTKHQRDVFTVKSWREQLEGENSSCKCSLYTDNYTLAFFVCLKVNFI